MEGYDEKKVRKLLYLQLKGMERHVQGGFFLVCLFAVFFLLFSLETKYVFPIATVIGIVLLIMFIWNLVLCEKKGMELRKYIFLYVGVCCILIALFCMLSMLLFYYFRLAQESILFMFMVLLFIPATFLLAKMWVKRLLTVRDKNNNNDNPQIAALAGTGGALGLMIASIAAKNVTPAEGDLVMIIILGIMVLMFGTTGMVALYKHILGKKYKIL